MPGMIASHISRVHRRNGDTDGIPVLVQLVVLKQGGGGAAPAPERRRPVRPQSRKESGQS